MIATITILSTKLLKNGLK